MQLASDPGCHQATSSLPRPMARRLPNWWVFPRLLLVGLSASLICGSLLFPCLNGRSFRVFYWWVFKRLESLIRGSLLFPCPSSVGLSVSLIDGSFRVSYWWAFPRRLVGWVFPRLSYSWVFPRLLLVGLSASLIGGSFRVSYWRVFPRLLLVGLSRLLLVVLSFSLSRLLFVGLYSFCVP